MTTAASLKTLLKTDMEVQRLQQMVTGGVSVSDNAVRDNLPGFGHEGEVRLRGAVV